MDKNIKKEKFFYALLAILAFSAWILFPGQLTLQDGMFFNLGLLFLLAMSLISLYSPKSTLFTLILIVPTIMIFRDKQINLSSFLSYLPGLNLPLNFMGLTAGLIVLFGAITCLANWEKVLKMPLKYLILLYLGYIFISIFWTPDKNSGLITLFYLFAPIFAYIYTYCLIETKSDFIKIIIATILSAIGPVIYALWQLITGNFFFEQGRTYFWRLNATFHHPNVFGSYLFIIISLIIIFYLAKKNKKIIANLPLILFTALLSFDMLLTFSRTAWAAMAIFLFIFLLAYPLLLLFTALSGITFLSIIYRLENFRLKIDDLTGSYVVNSMVSRQNIWKTGIQEFFKKPIFGHGVGSAEKTIELANSDLGSYIPHNDGLLFALEGGIIGAITFIFLKIAVVFHAIKIWLQAKDDYSTIIILGKKIEINFRIIARGLLIILIAYLVESMIETSAKKLQEQVMLWALIGAAFSAFQEINKNQQKI